MIAEDSRSDHRLSWAFSLDRCHSPKCPQPIQTPPSKPPSLTSSLLKVQAKPSAHPKPPARSPHLNHAPRGNLLCSLPEKQPYASLPQAASSSPSMAESLTAPLQKVRSVCDSAETDIRGTGHRSSYVTLLLLWQPKQLPPLVPPQKSTLPNRPRTAGPVTNQSPARSPEPREAASPKPIKPPPSASPTPWPRQPLNATSKI